AAIIDEPARQCITPPTVCAPEIMFKDGDLRSLQLLLRHSRVISGLSHASQVIASSCLLFT
ncbi:hypothetical protein BT96DRAFT_927967, partial [Gymnopus androsaceus JB14]